MTPPPSPPSLDHHHQRTNRHFLSNEANDMQRIYCILWTFFICQLHFSFSMLNLTIFFFVSQFPRMEKCIAPSSMAYCRSSSNCFISAAMSERCWSDYVRATQTHIYMEISVSCTQHTTHLRTHDEHQQLKTQIRRDNWFDSVNTEWKRITDKIWTQCDITHLSHNNYKSVASRRIQ